MKHRLHSAAAALCAALSILFLFSSCHENTIIRSPFTELDSINTVRIGRDFNNGTDTMQALTILTKTVRQDSIVTSTRLAGLPIYHALGTVVDPAAGKTAAGIYMQFNAPATGFFIPSGGTPQYVELVLPYAGFTWGDTTAPAQTIKVYRISQAFSKDSAFYNFNSLQTEGAVVGTGTLLPASIKDSQSVNGVNRAPHLRIRLSDAFRDFLIDQLKFDTSATAFTNAFRGLAIMPDSDAVSSGGALPYFILNSSGGTYGTASLLMHVGFSNNPDSLFSFRYTESNNAHFNRITRNYAGTLAESLLRSTAKDDPFVMMQNAPGTQIDVRLPNIQSLPKNIVINKAEIVFTRIDTLQQNVFSGPARLFPFGVNSSGGIYTIADRYPVSDATLSFIDGTPRAAIRAGVAVTEYRINIPREAQRAIVQGRDGLHLRIGGTANFPAAYRLLVGGSAASDARYRPYVNIIYSKQ